MSNKEKTFKKHRRLKVSYIFIMLFLIGVGAFTLYRLNLKKKLLSRIEAIRAAGYPMTCEELDQWYTIPDDVENAAYIILDSFDYYQEPEDNELLPVIGTTNLPDPTESLAEETKILISKYLNDNQKSLELLHETAALEHSRYPIDLTLGLGTHIYNLSELRRSARLLQLEAIYSAETNKPDIVVKSIKSIFGIARSINKEPIMVSQLVRIACESLAMSTFERVINKINFTDEQLVDLGDVVAKAQKLPGISNAFAGERCLMLSVFTQPELQYFDQTSGVPLAPVLLLYKALGLTDSDAIIYLDMMDEYMKAMQLPLHQRQKAASVIGAKINEISKIHILFHEFIPSFSGIITTDLSNIAKLRTAEAAIAVQRYRLVNDRPPETLKELVPAYLESILTDPFDGKELRYKKLESGFVVYSIGEDLSDDDGTEMPSTTQERRKTQNWDITFIVVLGIPHVGL